MCQVILRTATAAAAATTTAAAATTTTTTAAAAAAAAATITTATTKKKKKDVKIVRSRTQQQRKISIHLELLTLRQSDIAVLLNSLLFCFVFCC